jgi:transcriptional regulator with XRE-family HTH domain
MNSKTSQNQPQKANALNIKLGNAARELRESLGLSQRDAAERLGVTPVHLCNVEKNKTAPSQALVDRYRELWGVDLYVFAWCRHGDISKLPKGMQAAARALSKGWEQQISNCLSSS